MGWEPFAAARLRLVQVTTDDEQLRLELAAVVGDGTAPFEPSRALAADVDRCPQCARLHGPADLPSRDPLASGGALLCERHRERWNAEYTRALEASRPLGGDLEDVMRGVMASDQGGVELLTALRAQVRALRLVAEAHRRGAVRLPEALVHAVRDAERLTPSFLGGAGVARSAMR